MKISDQNRLEIAAVLGHGFENRKTTDELLTVTGIKTARVLQSQIAAERENGALILSSASGGYFLPADGEAGLKELAAFEATLRRRAISTLAALHATRAALAQVEGQQMLDDTPSGTRGGEDGVQS